jgi:hypothetical protein
MFDTKNTPNAAKLMDSLRALGYDNYSAICDLIDNSLDAEARNVWIDIRGQAAAVSIVIADDGCGMDSHVLDEALKLGSLTDRNSGADLGRYGMGLSTASLSIAKRTTVLSRSNGSVLKSVTDIDEIKKRNEFCKYLGNASVDEGAAFDAILEKSTGTLVELSKCDNLKNQNLSVFRNTLKGKIAEIYRYFLRAGKNIFVNGELVAAKDPLMLEEGAEVFSDESIDVALTNADGTEVNDKIRLRIVVLPDFGADGNKERKINLRGQGFYILRNNREIAAGQTLDLFTRHNDLNRLRAELFFPGTLDEFMGVNFTKQGVDPHQSIRDKIEAQTAGQIRTIRSRLKATRIASEDKEITHEESEKIISSKSHLLIRPKPPKSSPTSVRPDRKPGTRERKPAMPGPAAPSAPKANVRFESATLGKSGPIYEAEQEGKVTVIQWNVDHPFYERFILDRKDDKTLLTSVDFLVYSMATAELGTVNEDNYDMIQNIKAIMSANLRSLLS